MFVSVGFVFAAAAAAGVAPYVSACNCPIIWDGRVPQNYTPEQFDLDTSIYNNTKFLGVNQTWSQIVQFPSLPPSLFSSPKNTSKPLEINISNASIYPFNSSLLEVGFRRTELVPSINTGNTTDPTATGITTFHFSIHLDTEHPLNYSHEYQVFWHERFDLGADQLAIKTGVPFDAEKEDVIVQDPKTLRVVGTNSLTPEENVFVTNFTDDVWHNFAVTVGWSTNETTLYYSTNTDPLSKVAGPFTNDWSDQGLLHFGFLRLPIGPPTINIALEGYQAPIATYEGLIYDGLFVEDSSFGCVSLGE